MPSAYKCQNLGCCNEREYYCHDHKSTYCHGCKLQVHSQCQTSRILGFKIIREILTQLESKMDRIHHFTYLYQISSHFAGFKEELDIYKDKVVDFKVKTTSAIDENDFLSAQSLEIQGSSLLREIISSKMHSDFCMHKENIESCSHVDTRHLEAELIKKDLNEDLLRAQEIALQKIEKENQQKLIEIRNEEMEKCKQIYQKQMTELN